MSCFLLALLYGIQYPHDDGSCPTTSDTSSCLSRTSTLDPSQTYCEWIPFVNQTAGILKEMKNEIVLQSIPLSNAEAIKQEKGSQCMYQEVNASTTAGIVAETQIIVWQKA
jgi:hypothetical protein